MGFCILGGKENYLRKVISEKLTSLGEAIGIGASATQFADAIQQLSDDRYEDGKEDAASMTSSNVVYNQSFWLNTTGSASLSYTAPSGAKCLAFFHEGHFEGGRSSSATNGTLIGSGIALLNPGQYASVSGSCNGAYQGSTGALCVVKFDT